MTSTLLLLEASPFAAIQPIAALFQLSTTGGRGSRKNDDADYRSFAANYSSSGLEAVARAANAADDVLYRRATTLFCHRLRTAGLLDAAVVQQEMRQASVGDMCNEIYAKEIEAQAAADCKAHLHRHSEGKRHAV